MGKLVVKIICGRNLKGSDMFSDADGYVKLTIASKTFRTKAINNDSNPNWNETFSYFVSEAACDNLKLELWDANTFKDDLISNVVVPLNDLIKDTRILKRVHFPDGKGEIHLELLADFGAPAGSTPPQQQGYGYGAPPPQGGYNNPYAQQPQQQGGYGNPYAQQQQQQPPQQQYNYPGQNPYASNPYVQQQQQQQQRSPQPQSPPQSGGGGYPGASNYLPQGGGGGYSNPYAPAGHGHQPQSGGGYGNPYAQQQPQSGGGPQPIYSYPGQQQQPSSSNQSYPQAGGLGYLPSVGGQQYY